MRLGLDAYSLRWQGWNAFQILDYSARLGLDNVQFSERGFLASLDDGYLRSLRSHGDRLELSLEVGMLSFDRHSGIFDAQRGAAEQQLGEMFRAAKILGSPIVRCVLGNQADRLGMIPFEAHVEEGLRVLRAVSSLARDLEIRLAVENHGGVDLEIITGVPAHPRLVPYLDLESDFWKKYPGMLARDLAQFIRLAGRGEPEPLEQITLPPGARIPPAGESGEPLRAQQRRHLEESVSYARTVLGIGQRAEERRH